MNREKVLDIATVSILLAVLGLGASTAWERIVRPFLEDRPVRVDDWDELARTGHLLGSADAPLQIVEFGDYQCPGCRLLERRFEEFSTAYPGAIAIRYRHWPLPYHSAAFPAAVAAECAAAQGRFRGFHRLLMAESDWIEAPERMFIEMAMDVEVPDTSAFRLCLRDEHPAPLIERDVRAAREIGGRGTPTVVINGLLMRVMPDSAMLRSLLSDAGGLPRRTGGQDAGEGSALDGRDVLQSPSGSNAFARPTGPPPSLPEWELSDEPTLILGRREGPSAELFLNVLGAVQMTDGRMAVVNNGSAEVIVFDDAGGHLFTVGGEGAGPSDLRSPRLLPAARYDSLVLASRSPGRISVMRMDGSIEPVGSFDPRHLLRGVGAGGVIYHRSFTLGTRVTSAGPRPEDVEVGLLIPSTGARIPLDRYRYVTTYFDVIGGSRQRPYYMPLRSGLSVAPTLAGTALVVGNERTVRQYHIDGSSRDSTTLPLDFRTTTEENISNAIQAELDRQPADRRAEVEQVLRAIDYPEHLPFVKRLVPDEVGGFWAEVFPGYPEMEGANWMAVSGEDEAVARISVPEALDVFQVGADFVVGTTTDALGVQRVVRYHLTR